MNEELKNLQRAIDDDRLSQSWRETVTDDEFRRTLLVYKLGCLVDKLTLDQLQAAEDFVRKLLSL
jgi:hypothetical protein